jgi:hypothetical protein
VPPVDHVNATNHRHWKLHVLRRPRGPFKNIDLEKASKMRGNLCGNRGAPFCAVRLCYFYHEASVGFACRSDASNPRRSFTSHSSRSPERFTFALLCKLREGRVGGGGCDLADHGGKANGHERGPLSYKRPVLASPHPMILFGAPVPQRRRLQSPSHTCPPRHVSRGTFVGNSGHSKDSLRIN